MENYPDNFKLPKRDENVEKTEKQAFKNSEDYQKLNEKIQTLNVKIKSIEEEIVQKEIEKNNIQKLISFIYNENSKNKDALILDDEGNVEKMLSSDDVMLFIYKLNNEDLVKSIDDIYHNETKDDKTKIEDLLFIIHKIDNECDKLKTDKNKLENEKLLLVENN